MNSPKQTAAKSLILMLSFTAEASNRQSRKMAISGDSIKSVEEEKYRAI